MQFINASGNTAHLWFGENDAIRFYVERTGSTIKFERPGTYDYTVHVTAAKVQAHRKDLVKYEGPRRRARRSEARDVRRHAHPAGPAPVHTSV